MILIAGLIPVVVSAQNAITGNVTDASTNEALPGVNVVIKGSTTGTNTDADGNYTLVAAPDDVLIFSFIGYSPVEITVGTQTTVNLSLQADVTQLNEVIVTGYTTQRISFNRWLDASVV
jgi:hypothetical protein